PRRAPVAIGRNQFEAKPAGIVERDAWLAKKRFEVARDHIRGPQAMAPEFQRSHRHREHGRDDLARALAPDSNAVSLVWKRRPDRARRATLGAVIEVIDVVIVEVDGLLDEPHAKQLDAEI